MAKFTDDFFLDDFLNALATCTNFAVCTTQPANQAGIAALTLASTTLTAGAGNGDYVIANGDTNGRKVTVGQQASLSITSSGDAQHIALDDGTNIWGTTVTLQALTSGGTVTVNAFDAEISDPS